MDSEAIRTNFCLNCEAQANTIEELRSANERWVIAFNLVAAEERAKIVALAAEWMGDIEFAQFKHAIEADREPFTRSSDT